MTTRSPTPPWPTTQEVVDAGQFTENQLKWLRKRKLVRRKHEVVPRPPAPPLIVCRWDPGGLQAILDQRIGEPCPEGHIPEDEATRAPFDFPASTLARWRRRCPYLGRPLVARQDRRSGGWFYKRADLEEIQRQRPLALGRRVKAMAAPWTDPKDGSVWQPSAHVERVLRIPTQVLEGLLARDHGTTRKRKRGGRQGRPRLSPSVRKRMIANRAYWSDEDLKVYVTWRSRRNGDELRSSDPAFLTDKEASRALDVSISTLYHWRSREEKCIHLGRALHAEKRNGVWHNSRADLEKIAARMEKALPAPANVARPQAAPAAAHPESPGEPAAAERRRRRGQRGRGQNTEANHEKIIAAAKSGNYGSQRELARQEGVSKSLVSKVLKAAGIVLTSENVQKKSPS